MQCGVPTEPYERPGLAGLDDLVMRGLHIAFTTYHTIKQGGGYDVHGNVERRLDIQSIAMQTKRVAAAANRAAIAMLPCRESAVYRQR